MNVTLSTPTTLKVTFPYNAATVARVKTVSGATWDKERRAWFAPIAALPALETIFGHVAQFDYGALVAYDESRSRAAGELFRMLRRSGASFRVTEDDIVLVEGDCVSPLVADLVAERSRWIAPFVGRGEPAVAVEREPVEATRNDELLAKSIAGAVAAEKRKAQYRREWWERDEAKQPSLFGETQ